MKPRRAKSPLTGEPIPRCQCGAPVYSNGKCWGCYTRKPGEAEAARRKRIMARLRSSGLY